jgi:hypothetical protein
MSSKKPLTPEQALALSREEERLDGLVEEVLAMNDEALDADLAKHGVTPKPAPTIDLATYRNKVIAWQATAATALLVAAAMFALYHATPEVTDGGTYASPPDAASPSPGAEERERGLRYCAEGNYGYCLMWLDMAQKKDPTSNMNPSVITARKLAQLATDGGAK